MSKPILYGIDTSPPFRCVLLTAHAIGLDLEIRKINPFIGENKTEEYLKMNPQHTVPTLEEAGKYLWDSHAIASYLVGKYAKNDDLYPEDLFTRAVINQRMHFDSGTLFPRMQGVVFAMRERNEEKLKQAETAMLEAYDFLEKFLGNNSYMAGSTLTLADLAILSTLSTINLKLPVDEAKFPQLASWLQRMHSLPYYEEANGKGIENVKEAFKKLLEGS